MNLTPWIVILTIFFLHIQSSTIFKQRTEYVTAQASSISTNMMVYKRAASAYAAANPAYTGTIADTSLSLPSWFTKTSGVTHYMTAGTAYVLYTTPTPGLAYQLLKSTNNTITTGINQGGHLVNPSAGTTSISLPSAIPDGAVVLM